MGLPIIDNLQVVDETSTIKHGIKLTLLYLMIATIFVWQFKIEPNIHLWHLLSIVFIINTLKQLLPLHWNKIIIGAGTIIGSMILVGPAITCLTLSCLIAILLIANIFKRTNNSKRKWPGVIVSLIIPVIITLQFHPSGLKAVALLGILLMFRLPYLIIQFKNGNYSEWDIEKGLFYLFLLPNLTMPVFPVIPPHDGRIVNNIKRRLLLQKKGIILICLGIMQLLIYRILFTQFYILPENVDNIQKLFHHAIINFLLLIRISGMFYVATGALNLLDFPTKPAIRSFLMPNSPLDFCYRFHYTFKDFLIKLFNPIFKSIIFRMKNTLSLFFLTYSLFFWAWMIHSMQWYWVQGHFPIRWSDLIFWTTFGLMVSLEITIIRNNFSVLKYFHNRNSNIVKSTLIVATLLILSQIWCIQAFHSPRHWLLMWENALTGSDTYWYYLILELLLITGAIAMLVAIKKKYSPMLKKQNHTILLPSILTAIMGILSVSQIIVNELPSDNHAARHWNKILSGRNIPNSEIAMAGGYYSAIFPMIRNIPTEHKDEWRTKERFEASIGAIHVDDFRQIAQAPNKSFTFKGKSYTTNSMGFRDREYSQQPDDETIRTIILGSSFAVGAGVADKEVFDVHLEEEMNKFNHGSQYEFINAGCSTYDLIDCLVRYDKDSISTLSPDYVFFISHGIDKQKNIIDLARITRKKLPLPYGYLDEIVQEAGISDAMGEASIINKLKPFAQRIVEESYQLLYNKCSNEGIIPVWIYWPTIGVRPTMDLDVNEINQVVERIGYRTINLKSVYDNHPPSELYVSPDDRHPNAEGHRLFAKALRDTLLNDPSFIDLR